MKAHVLVVSTALDLSTDAVVRSLTKRGVRVTRWNTEDFPLACRLTSRVGRTAGDTTAELTRPGAPLIALSDVTAVWYRRVRIPDRPPTMDEGVYDFCVRESRAALHGALLGGLPSEARWMSPPPAVWAAEHKLFQLRVARDVGMVIPETVVTNDAAEARVAFARFGGQMIAKPVRTGYIEIGGAPHAIYTSAVSASDLEDMSGAELSPVIYQPLIPKRCDVRVTVVGDQLFIAEIDSQGNEAAKVDWRRTDDPLLPHRRGSIPDELAAAVREFMRRLGLTFGALDFVATPDGELVFLEVNPNGQWLWLDDQLELGISDTVAQWLAPEGQMGEIR